MNPGFVAAEQMEFYLSPEANARLGKLALESCSTQAEIIRRRVNSVLEEARIASAQKARGWTRDELYDERFSRWPLQNDD
jgi:hypothetical protein